MEDSSARNEGASRPSPSEPPPLSRAATDFSASGAGLDDADLSREGSDDESVDLEPRDGVSLSGSIKSLSQSALKAEAGDLAGEEETTGGSSSMPVQKRRRVTRACDECRRKKIKCDGKQPCTHCSVYSYGNKTIPSAPFILAPRSPGPTDPACWLTMG